MDQMSRCPDLISESSNPKTFHCSMSLLQGESISLRPSIKTRISLVESKGNTSMKTAYSESYSAYSATNNRNMWIIGIDGWRWISRNEPRTITVVTCIYMSFWSNWYWSYFSIILISHKFFLIPSLFFFSWFLSSFADPITLGTDFPVMGYISCLSWGHMIFTDQRVIFIVAKNYKIKYSISITILLITMDIWAIFNSETMQNGIIPNIFHQNGCSKKSSLGEGKKRG